MYYVYILRCSDGSYYVGHTEDLESRLVKHNEGRATSYTAARCPVVIVYYEPSPDRLAAAKREQQIKRWSRAKKEALINSDELALKVLSRRRCR